jgi:hypothetical protein
LFNKLQNDERLKKKNRPLVFKGKERKVRSRTLIHAVAVLDGLTLDVRASEAEAEEAERCSDDYGQAQVDVVDHEDEHQEVAEQRLDAVQCRVGEVSQDQRRPVETSHN